MLEPVVPVPVPMPLVPVPPVPEVLPPVVPVPVVPGVGFTRVPEPPVPVAVLPVSTPVELVVPGVTVPEEPAVPVCPLLIISGEAPEEPGVVPGLEPSPTCWASALVESKKLKASAAVPMERRMSGILSPRLRRKGVCFTGQGNPSGSAGTWQAASSQVTHGTKHAGQGLHARAPDTVKQAGTEHSGCPTPAIPYRCEQSSPRFCAVLRSRKERA
ncbi:hypothetical protein D7X30_01735 [Corallococcus sp. AB011P]|nr:hypothetical protein D7X30_01735 [Corallococcus sp. AB011P]